MMLLTVERSKHWERLGLRVWLEHLWGYPRGTCRTGISSRVRTCASTQNCTRKASLVGALHCLGICR